MLTRGVSSTLAGSQFLLGRRFETVLIAVFSRLFSISFLTALASYGTVSCLHEPFCQI
jgi:hypothetical protein